MRKYFYRVIGAFCLIIVNVNFIWSLECIYCPLHVTEEECNQMNVTQICVNETMCGYARFIEEREDGHNKSILTITVKKGCMQEDYCTRLQQSDRGLHVNFSQCIFCNEDLCILGYPLLCMECNEPMDEYCAIQTGRVVTCGPQQVCYEQRNQSTAKLKRGCIEPSKCLNKNLCRHCNTDLCRIDAKWPPFMENRMKNNEETLEDNNFYENSSRVSNQTNIFNVILIISFNFFIKVQEKLYCF